MNSIERFKKYNLNIINEYELNLYTIKQISLFSDGIKKNDCIRNLSKDFLETFNESIINIICKYTSIFGSTNYFDNLLTLNRMFITVFSTDREKKLQNIDGFTYRYINQIILGSKSIKFQQKVDLIDSIEIELKIPYKEDKLIILYNNGLEIDKILIKKNENITKKIFDNPIPFNWIFETYLEWDENITNNIKIIVTGIFITSETEKIRKYFNKLVLNYH